MDIYLMKGSFSMTLPIFGMFLSWLYIYIYIFLCTICGSRIKKIFIDKFLEGTIS